MLSQAPEICTLFALNVSPSQVRQAIRLEFERNRYVSGPKGHRPPLTEGPTIIPGGDELLVAGASYSWYLTRTQG